MDPASINQAVSQNRDDNYFRSIGFPRGRQDAMDYLDQIGFHKGGGGGGSSVPKFNFSWEQAEQDALAKLTPYYEQKLAESEGDVNLAKSRLEEDYQKGIRIRQEDLTAQQTELGRQTTEENLGTQEALNRRGVLFGEIPQGDQTSKAPISGFAQTFYMNPQQERQDARRLAVERATQRAGETSTTERARDIQDISLRQSRYKSALGEEKKQRAVTEMAPMAYQREYSKYLQSIG